MTWCWFWCWWCWVEDMSLWMRSWTYLKSLTWQGMIMVPCWWKPYSSSASFRSRENKGWLRYITGITIFSCSSPCPTLIGKNPFGISLITTFFLCGWWWGHGKLVTATSPKLFSSLSHIRRQQRFSAKVFRGKLWMLRGVLLASRGRVMNPKCSNVRKWWIIGGYGGKERQHW